jgi:catechol 2,3-dioxygenase-like lactoylglutathione lyase family enzyme
MHVESFFHVALKAEDVDEAAAFYREWFGAELLERGHADSEEPRSSGSGSTAGDGEEQRSSERDEGATAVEHAALSVGGVRVYLFDRAPYEAAGLTDDLPTGFLHFGFVVDDVEAAHEELAAAGVEFVMEPSTFGDLRIAFFTDPTGTRIELLEHR